MTHPTSQKRMAPSEPPLQNSFSCTGCHDTAKQREREREKERVRESEGTVRERKRERKREGK